MKYRAEWSREDMRGGKAEFSAVSDAKAIEIFRKEYLQNRSHDWDFLQLFRIKKCKSCGGQGGELCIVSRLDGRGSTKYRKGGKWVKAPDLDKKPKPKPRRPAKKRVTDKTISLRDLRKILTKVRTKEIVRDNNSWGDTSVHTDQMIFPAELLYEVEKYVERKR